MEYEFFDKIQFLEDKIASFERSHYERLLELEGFSDQLPRLKEELEAIIASFAEGIDVLKAELKVLIDVRDEEEEERNQ